MGVSDVFTQNLVADLLPIGLIRPLLYLACYYLQLLQEPHRKISMT